MTGFFIVLFALILAGLLRGCYTGELKFEWDKGCREEYCEPADGN